MQTVDTETREPVERSATVRAKIEKGRYVAVTDEELRELKPRAAAS